jgi:ELWxxDGT repeat protein/YD repeat-containing protein
LASYSYDTLGRLDTLTRANGATTSYSYDGADRLLQSSTVVSGTTVSAFQYGVDRLGLRTVVTETLGISTTALVADIQAGSGSSSPGAAVTLNGTLFFAASDGTNGSELWKSDGTSAGTVQVKDIATGSGSSSPGNLTVVNRQLRRRRQPHRGLGQRHAGAVADLRRRRPGGRI